MKWLLLLAAPSLFFVSINARISPPGPDMDQLVGKWEVVQYAEQGVQVDKKGAIPDQARRVYEHVRERRITTFYGPQPVYDQLNRRESREFKEWIQRDSINEVRRLMDIIPMPYYAVFFADSTLSLYNKEEKTGHILVPESRRFTFSKATMSLDIFRLGGYDRSDVQVLYLDDQRMTLYIPEEAEIVQLIKRPFDLP
jgi:hypothetical protein